MEKMLYINKLPVLAWIGVCLLTFFPAAADDEADRIAKEYQVKAAYMYNLIKYIEWPGEKSLNHAGAIATVCIIGEDPFGHALNLLKQASSTQLAFDIKRNITEKEIPNCHVLFISQSEEDRVASIIARTNNLPILTVSEIKKFTDIGGVVEMTKVEQSVGLFAKDKINLRINKRVADEKKLGVSAQVLEIAAEVIK